MKVSLSESLFLGKIVGGICAQLKSEIPSDWVRTSFGREEINEYKMGEMMP